MSLCPGSPRSYLSPSYSNSGLFPVLGQRGWKLQNPNPHPLTHLYQLCDLGQVIAVSETLLSTKGVLEQPFLRLLGWGRAPEGARASQRSCCLSGVRGSLGPAGPPGRLSNSSVGLPGAKSSALGMRAGRALRGRLEAVPARGCSTAGGLCVASGRPSASCE